LNQKNCPKPVKKFREAEKSDKTQKQKFVAGFNRYFGCSIFSERKKAGKTSLLFFILILLT